MKYQSLFSGVGRGGGVVGRGVLRKYLEMSSATFLPSMLSVIKYVIFTILNKRKIVKRKIKRRHKIFM